MYPYQNIHRHSSIHPPQPQSSWAHMNNHSCPRPADQVTSHLPTPSSKDVSPPRSQYRPGLTAPASASGGKGQNASTPGPCSRRGRRGGTNNQVARAMVLVDHLHKISPKHLLFLTPLPSFLLLAALLVTCSELRFSFFLLDARTVSRRWSLTLAHPTTRSTTRHSFCSSPRWPMFRLASK